MAFPRVLHIGFNPIGSPTNTGLTLESMFGAWPRDKLFELYLPSRQPLQHHANTVVAPRMVAPVDGAVRSVLGSRIPAPTPDGMNNSVSGRTTHLPWRYRLRAAGATLNEIGPVTTRGSWLDPISAFQPQVIHSLLGGVRVMKLVAGVAERLSLPVVPHFMDDWPANLFADGQLLGLARREVERTMDRVMTRAPLCLAIGDDMRSEFQERFQRPCYVVGNSIDFADFEVAEEDVPPDNSDGPRRFVYMGGLHLGRDRALAELATAIVADPRLRDRVVLVIHAPATDARRLAMLVAEFPKAVVAGNTVAPKDVPETLLAAHGLVFVESNRGEVLNFTRLSISTKVPEYLAARKPVIALGPEDQSSIRELRRSGATRYANPEDPSSVASAMLAALSITDNVPGVSAVQREQFGRSRVQDRLRLALSKAASDRG